MTKLMTSISQHSFTNMTEQQELETFQEDGIFYRHWKAEKGISLKGAVLLVHGLNDHCERYTELAGALNKAGFAVCSCDLPGHGRSDGKRGHIDKFADFSAVILKLRGKMQWWYPDLPIFLLGHSMGSGIVLDMLPDYQDEFHGAMISACLGKSKQEPPRFQKSIIRLLARVAPHIGVLKLDVSGISTDPAVVEDALNDPFSFKKKLTARFVNELITARDRIRENLDRIKLPIMFLHGGNDEITFPSGSQFAHDTVASKDKQIQIYDGLKHEIFNEPEKKMVYNDAITWLNRHC